MRIAILGAGNIGGGLGRAWASKNHQVTFGTRDPDGAAMKALCAETGAKAASTHKAVQDAEVVVLSVPYAAVDAILSEAGPLVGKIVLDCTNAIGPGLSLTYGHTTSASEEIAKKIPGARVVKSFNAQGAENLANPVYGGIQATNFYCGDDEGAKGVVKALVQDVGFEAVDAGPLKNARLLEPLAVLWISTSKALGTRDLAFKLLRR